jgi:hypothetical protein
MLERCAILPFMADRFRMSLGEVAKDSDSGAFPVHGLLISSFMWRCSICQEKDEVR